MIFPKGRRRNSRYRGPMESKKANSFYIEVIDNIKILSDTLNSHEQSLNDIKSNINNIQRNEMVHELIKMKDTINISTNLKGE